MIPAEGLQEPEQIVPQVLIRRINLPEDSLEELTDLLHRAYAALGEAGFRYYATHQTPEETRERCERGYSYVALIDGRIVGTITLYDRHTDDVPWYSRPDVGYFGQFGVEPELQGKGIGRRMLRMIEERARELGLRELALDTAEGAHHLVEWYGREGYRIVAHHSWNVTNYRSVIMSRTL